MLPLSTLSSLALTVERHGDGGGYFWKILESFDHSDVFEPLLESAEFHETYALAIDAGAAAFKRLAAALATGPAGTAGPLGMDLELDD